ncbi:MAG: hypothetical protein HQ541_18725, partial [Mariniphaga sp.]|nr:hypothetical protein [Mariniphaga sp.]
MPGEPIFKFEYQKGSPWRHENLIASFDFAIQKTDVEIENEKLEKLKKLTPYFKLDTAVNNSLLKAIRHDLLIALDTFNTLENNTLNRLTSEFDNILKTGILQRSVDSYEILEGKMEIAQITGNISVKIQVNQLYSEKSAYNYFTGILTQVLQEDPELQEKTINLDITKYIKANLEYDTETTQKQIEEIESFISTTQGMVQAGERIILNGEIVDAEKFNILESLKTSYKKKQGEGFNKYMITAGKSLLIIILLTLVFIFLYFYRKDILNHFRRLTF